MNDDRNQATSTEQDDQDVEQMVEAQATSDTTETTNRQTDGDGELDDRSSKFVRIP